MGPNVSGRRQSRISNAVKRVSEQGTSIRFQAVVNYSPQINRFGWGIILPFAFPACRPRKVTLTLFTTFRVPNRMLHGL